MTSRISPATTSNRVQYPAASRRLETNHAVANRLKSFNAADRVQSNERVVNRIQSSTVADRILNAEVANRVEHNATTSHSLDIAA